VSKAYKNEMLRLAVVSQSLWDLYMKSFDMYEVGSIKGQILTSKQLMTKPEVKQTQFQCLLPLSEETQKKLLSLVISEELSLRDLKKRSEKEKKLSDLRDKFVHLTNCKSWKDAETRFPIHTKQDKLEQFLTLNFKKATPQAFSQFCAEAVLYTTEPDLCADIECTAKISEINKCTFVEVTNLSSFDPSVIKSGGSLFLFYMGKVSFVCDIMNTS
jgi:hypothetical protein